MATTDIDQLGYEEIMPRIGELAGELLSHPDDEVRVQIEELLDWIDVFHRAGLERVVDLIKAWRGELFLEQAEKDEIIGPFLTAYDLNETAEAEQAPGPEPELAPDGELS